MEKNVSGACAHQFNWLSGNSSSFRLMRCNKSNHFSFPSSFCTPPILFPIADLVRYRLSIRSIFVISCSISLPCCESLAFNVVTPFKPLCLLLVGSSRLLSITDRTLSISTRHLPGVKCPVNRSAPGPLPELLIAVALAIAEREFRRRRNDVRSRLSCRTASTSPSEHISADSEMSSRICSLSGRASDKRRIIAMYPSSGKRVLRRVMSLITSDTPGTASDADEVLPGLAISS
mmetsp:Transcript_28537/g.59461  ORF Transcript_28537/g.59461 Transcript_28537/m.59461 type:complete len:233 (+) Transcript_28537:775-1473(+)